MTTTIPCLMAVLLISSCMPGLDATPPRPSSCGDGSWRSGWFEIHHLDLGRGVATLIISPSGRSLLIDVGEANWDSVDGAKTAGAYVEGALGCKKIDYVLISHFHVDHAGVPGYGGLWHLTQVQGFVIGKLVHRDFEHFQVIHGSGIASWKTFLASSEGQRLNPENASINKNSIELGGGVEVRVVAANGLWGLQGISGVDNAIFSDENDASIALLVRFGLLDYLTAGDLSGEDTVRPGYSYYDQETDLALQVRDLDVYRVSHHGSRHSSNETLVAQMQPRVSILQVGNDNTNGHPHQAVIDRLLGISRLYLTQKGDPAVKLGHARVVGAVVLRSRIGKDYTVAGDSFVATDPPRKDQDGDGYFSEADPDDGDATRVPARKVSDL